MQIHEGDKTQDQCKKIIVFVYTSPKQSETKIKKILYL